MTMGPSNADRRKGAVFMGMGFELVSVVIGFAYLGEFIDNHFGWAGYATAGLIFLGLGVWLWHLIYLLKQMDKNQTPPKPSL